MNDENAEQIKSALVRIDTHVEQLANRMDKHDERLSTAEANIIEERGIRQGVERAMLVEHERIHEKIDSLGRRLGDGIESIRASLSQYTEREDNDRRVMMRLLWMTLFSVGGGILTFILARVSV